MARVNIAGGFIIPAAHRVPVIDRMMDVLDVLQRSSLPISVRDLAISTGVPRSTVYRILNTLEAHAMVVKAGAEGGYQLGSHLMALAARLPQVEDWRRLQHAAEPWLQRLAAETAETTKLSVLNGNAALCVAIVQGQGPDALAAMVGGRYPLHAGAASKVLLAAVPDPARAALLAGPLPSYTARTITDPVALQAQLIYIARQGWAEDTGEHGITVGAVAAPVYGGTPARTVAAVSIAYLTARTAAQKRRYRDAAIRTAADIGAVVQQRS